MVKNRLNNNDLYLLMILILTIPAFSAIMLALVSIVNVILASIKKILFISIPALEPFGKVKNGLSAINGIWATNFILSILAIGLFIINVNLGIVLFAIAHIIYLIGCIKIIRKKQDVCECCGQKIKNK